MPLLPQAVRAYETYWKHRNTFRYLDELRRSQYDRPEVHAAQRLGKLRELLQHACEHTTFYSRTLRDLGGSPMDIRTQADFTRLPVVSREAMQAQPAEFTTTDPAVSSFPKATGGSTGAPLRFMVERDSDDRRMAASHRGYEWAGVPPGTKTFYLWGVPSRGNRAVGLRLKDRLHNALYGRIPFSTFDLGPSTIAAAHRTLMRAAGGSAIGFPSSLFEMALLLEQEGLVAPPLQSVIVGAEKLHPHMRAKIESVFGAPVFETYGSREFMLIAAECEAHAGLHLTAEHHIVEVLDDDGHPVPAGVEGNVAVTDLTNRAFPFIRYLNGDRAVMRGNTCACGRSLPLLESVVGRSADILVLGNGTRLSGLLFPHLLKEVPGLRQFQVEQTSPDAITLRIVVDGEVAAESLGPMNAELAAVSDQQLRVRIERVDRIPRTAAGKHKVVIALPSPPGM